ncbi:hypothetical protein V6Z11_A13G140600 [Gossypium hirsutum]
MGIFVNCSGFFFWLLLWLQTTLATTDTSCESVVTSGQHHLTPQHPPRDASLARLLHIAEETLTEFLSKATGTAVEWVQMSGMKPGPDSIGIVAISHGCSGVAARAYGLVGLDPTRVSSFLLSTEKICFLAQIWRRID